MTAKDKAKELVNKMHIENDVIYVMSKVQAKRCALIMVDEIVNAIAFDFENTSKDTVYWLKVKQEIKNL